MEHNKTVIYAGVYERGEGGDVCVIYPDEGPCYACWAEHLREGLADPHPDSQVELDYGMIEPGGTLAAEPGLYIHVVRIAATQADMALNQLLEDTHAYREMPTNTVILANTKLEIYEGRITPPYGAEWVNVPRNPDCLVCGHLHRPEAAETPDVTLNDLIGQGFANYEHNENES
jgi:hypothetical protein